MINLFPCWKCGDGRASRYVAEPVGYQLPHPEAKPPKLNPEIVPAEFRHLIPLAAKYGVSDDGYRLEMLDPLGSSERAECAQFLPDYDDARMLAIAQRENRKRWPKRES